MPLTSAIFPFVRAATIKKSATPPSSTKLFFPESVQPPPDFAAFNAIFAGA